MKKKTYAIRYTESGNWLAATGRVQFSTDKFSEAHLFDTLEDARRECARYPTWRHVVEVTWALKFEEPCGYPALSYLHPPKSRTHEWETSLKGSRRFDSPDAAKRERERALYPLLRKYARVVRVLKRVRA